MACVMKPQITSTTEILHLFLHVLFTDKNSFEKEKGQNPLIPNHVNFVDETAEIQKGKGLD